MILGKKKIRSPIIQALRQSEHLTTAVIRVHISKKWIDFHPDKSATALFEKLNLDKTEKRNAVLIYINQRWNKIAIVWDIGINSSLDQIYWHKLIQHLKEDLHTTWLDNAIALTVQTLSFSLNKYFPRDQDLTLKS